MKTKAECEDPCHQGPQEHPTKANRCRPRQKRNIDYTECMKIGEILKYCYELITWEEAKPILDMIEKKIGSNAPPRILEAIKKVKKHFEKKMFCGVIKTKSVSIGKGFFKGPMNKITRNRHVDLSK